jgi:hypothetical protein
VEIRFLKAFSDRQLIDHRRDEDVRNKIEIVDINSRIKYYQLDLLQHPGGTEENRFHE